MRNDLQNVEKQSKEEFLKKTDEEYNNMNENYDKLDEKYLQMFYERNDKLIYNGVIKNEKKYNIIINLGGDYLRMEVDKRKEYFKNQNLYVDKTAFYSSKDEFNNIIYHNTGEKIKHSF